ncbi:MAG: hypothetical protein GY765_28040 [bacterium]|nr:hypothetical protein [bacterium]
MSLQWEQDLLNLTPGNVSIQARSLTRAWKELSTAYLLRSVLFVSDVVEEDIPFHFQSEKCRNRDIFDALASTYQLTRVADERTGVSWFLPKGQAYDRVLAPVIQLEPEQLGLPMQSGILEPLALVIENSGILVKQWGSLFQNTFNYAVNLAAGEYTVRDILNACCAANPTKTFLVRKTDKRAFITAVNIVSDAAETVPAGALYLWDSAIGPRLNGEVPTQKHVMTALAHQDAKVRYAARNYLEAIIWNAPVDQWVASGSSTEQVLWTCLGVTSVLVRTEEATHPASIETIKRLATQNFLTRCEPGLAVMTALELARLTKDASGIRVIKKRNPGAIELVGVLPDACRIAALSGFVRNALQTEKNETSAGRSLPPTNVSQLISNGKLELRGTERGTGDGTSKGQNKPEYLISVLPFL